MCSAPEEKYDAGAVYFRNYKQTKKKDIYKSLKVPFLRTRELREEKKGNKNLAQTSEEKLAQSGKERNFLGKGSVNAQLNWTTQDECKNGDP